MTTPAQTRRHPPAQWIALCAAALLLPGCGGGGGGSSPQAPPDIQTKAPPPAPKIPLPPEVPEPTVAMPPPFPRTAAVLNGADDAGFAARKREFENTPGYTTEDWELYAVKNKRIQGRIRRVITFQKLVTDQGLRLINAAAAYARGATGAGEVVGVRDEKIYRDHEAFATRDVHGDVIGSKVTFARDDIGNKPEDGLDHGTYVAGLIAAQRHSTDRPHSRKIMHGVAFDATVVGRSFITADLDLLINPCTRGDIHGLSDFDLSLCTEEDDKVYAAFLNLDYAREAGATIVNHSITVGERIDGYDPDDVRKYFKHTAAELAQESTPDADKIIIVWAADNYENASPGLWAGLGAVFPELQSHVLAVVAVDQGGVIADFSSRCGSAKGFCLAAPGVDLIHPSNRCESAGTYNYATRKFECPDNRFRQYSATNGTSGSAPLVSGSLAVMRQFFRRQLGNTELVTRLLATANRDGIYADSDIYGHGLVDLDAATAPVGALNTSLSGDPLARPFTGGGFAQSGGAFGAAMQDALDGVEIAAFDQLDAPFFFPVTGGAAPRVSAAYDMNLREHEIEIGGGVSQSAS
ncbi:MAG: S8 family serine peptidase, partial [Gammaproteobacteria bacterium]